MTGSDEREGGAPVDGAGTIPEPSKEQRKAAKKAAKALKKQAKAAQDAAKRARKATKAEAAATAKAARAIAKAEAKSARADARAREAAKADAKAAKKAARAAWSGSVAAERPPSPAAAAASALLEEAAQLMRSADADHSETPAPTAEPQPEFGEPASPPVIPDTAEPEIQAGEREAEPEPWRASEVDAGFERANGLESPLEAVLADDARATGPEPAAEFEPEPTPESAPASHDAPAPEVPPVSDVPPAPAFEPEPEFGLAAPAPEGTAPEPSGEDDAEPAAPLPPVTADRSAPAVAVAPAGSPVAASIDVGSTSVHLLVGTVDRHRVVPLLDESEFLGLGDRVAAEGYLGDDLRASLFAALERYAAAARDHGAGTVTVVGTEPMRRAADAAAVVRDAQARLGLAFHVLDHGEEGLLTLVGATGGSPVTGELLLVDIGGGSSEFVIVGADGRARAQGLQLGAARLTREFVRSDPPSLAEIEALRREVSLRIADAPDASPTEIVAVGGTASNLLRLLPATAVDRSLTRRRIAVALAMLTVERSREAAVRHLIRPERARILPAGAIIVDAILERYRSDRLRVSEAGIREGVILAGAHAGAGWRDRLVPMANGWMETAAG